jgi:hypothetical protein
MLYCLTTRPDYNYSLFKLFSSEDTVARHVEKVENNLLILHDCILQEKNNLLHDEN